MVGRARCEKVSIDALAVGLSCRPPNLPFSRGASWFHFEGLLPPNPLSASAGSSSCTIIIHQTKRPGLQVI